MYLGIDAGTSSIKVTAFNESGRELASSRRSAFLKFLPSGRVEQDPVEIWRAVRSDVAECLKKSRISPQDIKAVGVTGQAGGMILVDKQGKPFKMISWRDLRAASLVEEWRERGKEKLFYAITGWPLWPQFAPIQLAWLAKHEPMVLKRASTVFSCSDWICSQLTGEKRAVAPALIGTIDTKMGKYSRELFRVCEISEWEKLFPELIQSWEIYGELIKESAKKIGLRPGTPVVSAGYDVACSAAGGNGFAKGKAICVLGTSGTNVVICNEPVQDLSKNIVCAYHIVPSRWLAISETMSATGNPDWFVERFCEEERRKAAQLSKSVFALCDDYVHKISVGADGLIYHPYLSGETAPFIALNARASFFGVTHVHTKMHFLRSIYEGVGYSVRHNFEHLESVLHEAYDEIVLVGGGSHSKVWVQMIADILGKRVSVTRNSENGCTGAALSAAVATNRFASFEKAGESFVHVKTTFHPNNLNVARYNSLFRIYVDLISKYRGAWNDLGRLSE